MTEAFLAGTRVVMSPPSVIVPFYLFSVRKDMGVKTDQVQNKLENILKPE
jgi:hypothetical protein